MRIAQEVLEGKNSAYSLRDRDKLRALAQRLGINPSSRTEEELSKLVVARALEEFDRQSKQPLRFATSTLSPHGSGLLQAFGLIPSSIEGAVSDLVRTSTLDPGADPIPLVLSCISCAIAHYDAMQISQDLTDVLLGTPRLVRTCFDPAAFEAGKVNIAVHSQSPLLARTLADVAERMGREAREAGASGINIIGISEGASRPRGRGTKSEPPTLPSLELTLATGAVDLLVADHRCVAPSLSDACQCTDAEMAASLVDVHLPFHAHVRFREAEAEQSAAAIIRMAIDAFRRHGTEAAAGARSEVIAGFSVEQIEDLLARMVPEDPWVHLVDAMKDGRVRGIALVAGCSNARAEREEEHLAIAKELLRNDVLVLATGCAAGAFARNGLLSGEATELLAGPGLRAFIEDLSRANGVPLPPIWYMGSCADNARAMNLATEMAVHLGVGVDAVPFAVSFPEAGLQGAVPMGTWFMAFGLPVHLGTSERLVDSPLVVEVLTSSAQDVFGGRFIVEPAPEEAAKAMLNELERRRWKLRLRHRYQVQPGVALSAQDLFAKSIEGATIATGFAERLLSASLERHGPDRKLEFPETGYALPAIYAWQGREVCRLADLSDALGQARSLIRQEPTLENAVSAGEALMVAAEAIEAIKYIVTDRPYEGTGYCGFIPDKVLRELGVALVDDTIPGCAVLIGAAQDPKALVKVVRDCQSKGMIIIASYDTIRQLQDEGVKVGADVRLYPVGEFTQVVHALNFAIRGALTFGNVQKGDRERLQNYLRKRPKVFSLQLGPIDSVKAAAGFAVLLNGSPTITDQEVEAIPDMLVPQPDYGKMVQTAIELRNINVILAQVNVPVAYGPAFEGETVRRPDTYVEAGGAAKTTAFELLRLLPEDQVEDGRITVIGKDVDDLPEGSRTSLAILVDVYGKRMQEDFESVLERRIHQFLNFAEGAWHTGQRSTIWVRLSKSSVRSGLRFKHFGDILVTKLKAEFGNIVSRVQVTIVTDDAKVQELLPAAQARYSVRDERLAGLTDEAVDTFFSCELCASFAPDHVCVIMPERLGLCGAINWLDAKAAREISPTGPNKPIPKGEVIDAAKGQWTGVNQAVFELTRGKLERFSAYTMMEDPMTSCGCFEVIVAMTADAQAVILVNREFPGMTPVGLKFSTLAGSIGGGKQTPGFIGIGRKYITSKKFIAADGGFLRIAWMPKALKDQLREALMRRAEEMGETGFVDKIADETITDTAEGLAEFMIRVDHPALRMPPLIQ